MAFTLDSILSPDGPIAKRIDGFELRPQQLQMAAAIERAFEARGHLMVEAGTGVGKSFAYLLPAIRRVVENNERVVIATYTISLQEQLIDKDIPLLNAAIPEEFSSVLVKGRGNYLSLRRLKLASDRQDRLFGDEASRQSLHRIEDWAYRTSDGTRSTLPLLQRPEVWDFAQSDSHNCMGKRCPTYDKCFYQSARRRMENGDLLICNHALFFADLALRTRDVGFLPSYDHVILDEAHNIEDVASEHFGLQLTEGRVRHLLRLLYSRRHHRGFLATLQTDAQELTDQTIEHVLRCGNISEDFFRSWAVWHDRHQAVNGWITEPNAVPDAISPPMKELATRLTALKQHAKRDADRFELNSYAERARAIAQEGRLLVEQKIEGCVYWVEASNDRRYRRRISLHCAPIEVGPMLEQHLFGAKHSTVLTSATLATGKENFHHARVRLGCADAETIQLGSPFDHAGQVEFFIARDMPDPNSQRFIDALVPRIDRHIRETDGGAFVLFTSFRMLNTVVERMKPLLVDRGHPIYVHGRDGPRGILLKRFRENERSVLFGTASFWQGVDVRGSTLRNVIITRLPFDVPDRPLIRARLERIREQGGNPFMDDQVPRAVLRFKQGFGRLIRSATDRGRVVVLDPRVANKPYGRVFRDALPEGIVAQVDEPVDVEAGDEDWMESGF